ncbi:MAG TPA: hypothetical protein VJB13_03090 [Candidatus Nanoarchaeia archaeon]|nr:hypothetical protein [Candidatus Nanoarchaeia archaeon]
MALETQLQLNGKDEGDRHTSFYGSLFETMPELRAEDRLPVSIAYIMKRRLHAPAEVLPAWRKNYVFTADGYDLYDLDLDGRPVGVAPEAQVSEQEAPIGATLEKPEQRLLKAVTKKLILPAARPYISGYDWETFSGRIPDQAPALGDVLLAAHKDHFVCEHSKPIFDQKMRDLYFPSPSKEEDKK